jgi:PAB-dependent poly(A)-specific ribonuclease subunit 2
MPYYRDLLLSAWPSHMTFEVGAPPPKLDPVVTSHLKRADMGYYAPNPKTGFRNQIQQTRRSAKGSGALGAPKFLSEKQRDAVAHGDDARRPSDALLEHLKDMNMNVGSSARKDVPAIYSNVEIKYSKFGVDDFDFR